MSSPFKFWFDYKKTTFTSNRILPSYPQKFSFSVNNYLFFKHAYDDVFKSATGGYVTVRPSL